MSLNFIRQLFVFMIFCIFDNIIPLVQCSERLLSINKLNVRSHFEEKIDSVNLVKCYWFNEGHIYNLNGLKKPNWQL